jgi:hypothetical protein
MEAFRVMYGLTSKLSVMVTGSASNHHSRRLPGDLIYHTHSGAATNYYTQNVKLGLQYPYLFNGFDFFAKYRLLSFDGKNQHLRIAAYGEWSSVNAAHHEAEPNLMDDTGGYGYGGIVTMLKNRFAASVTYGFIKPNSYYENQPYFAQGMDSPIRIYYGDAVRYNISFGYRFYPNHYTDYQQTNWNFYMEFMGKSYDAARVIQDGETISPTSPILMGGSYVEMHPGIQLIANSNFRMEFSIGLPFIGHSYTHTTPYWNFAIQRYFYRHASKSIKDLKLNHKLRS